MMLKHVTSVCPDYFTYIWIYYTTIALLISAKHSIRSKERHLTTTLSTNSKIKPRAKLLDSMLNQNHGCVSESFT